MIGRIIMLLAWFGLMFASLPIGRLELGHAICGAWGCGPPAAALLSMHTFWLAAIVPPMLYLSRTFPFPWKSLGFLAIGGTLLGLVAIGIWDFSVARNYYDSGYVWQRYLFRIATLVDLPIIQILITGVLVTIVGKQGQCCDKMTKVTAGKISARAGDIVEK